jgi:hypothetical protein
MMMHDPFQTYATLGQHYGIPSPIGLQYPSLQTSGINPAAAGYNPLLGLSQLTLAGGIPQMGQSPFGINVGQGPLNPQQLQIASLLASQGGLQNPLLASILSNPLIAASLYAQALGAHGALQYGGQQQPSPYPQIGQMGSPFAQVGSPFGQVGYPLAPQSWIGQGQVGPWGGTQGFGQVHPFQSQMGLRPFQGQGLSPWGY